MARIKGWKGSIDRTCGIPMNIFCPDNYCNLSVAFQSGAIAYCSYSTCFAEGKVTRKVSGK